MPLLDKNLERRDFLRASAAAGAAAAAFISGCAQPQQRASSSEGSSSSGDASTSSILSEGQRTPHVVESDTAIVSEAGEWMPIHCHQNCNQMCLNMGYVVDGVVVRQKTDDWHEDSFDCPQQRSCLRGRSLRQQVYNADRIKYPMKRRCGWKKTKLLPSLILRAVSNLPMPMLPWPT